MLPLFDEDTAIFCHSIYDMYNRDIANAMDSHDCMIGYGCVIFNAAVALLPSGELTDIDCHFERRKEKIVFRFRNDPSYHYEHNWETYIQFFRESCIVSSRKNMYYVEFMSNSHGSKMFFKIVRANLPPETNTLIYHSFYSIEREKW